MSMTEISTPLIQRVGENLYKINLETSAGSVKTNDGGNVEAKLQSLSKAVSGQTTVYVVDDIAARDALENLHIGDQCWVKDASGDESVESGAAKYIYESADVGWVKTAEAGLLDLSVDWNSVTGIPASSADDIDEAVSLRHGHDNKEDVLDRLGTDEEGRLTLDGVPVQTADTELAGRVGALEDELSGLPPEKPGIVQRVEELEKQRKTIITGPTTIYVAPDGDDTLDEGRGLTADKPFKTIQAAVDYAVNNFFVTKTVTINLASGEYLLDEPIYLPPYTACAEMENNANLAGAIAIKGESKSTTKITMTKDRILVICSGAVWRISDVTLQNSIAEISESTHTIVSMYGGILWLIDCDIKLPPCKSRMRAIIFATSHAEINLSGTISISSPSVRDFIRSSILSFVAIPSSVTLNGAATRAVITTDYDGVVAISGTLEGSVTGKRYACTTGGCIYTGGKGANVIPGTTAGTVESASGCIYY